MSDFDVIVTGSGIGGLTSASFLSRMGLKVLILEQGEVTGGWYNAVLKGGYSFDIGGSLLWGLGCGEVFHWLFSEFNILNNLLERESVIRKVEPGLQIILPDHRISLYSERDKFYEEIKREFPSDAVNLIKLYQESDRIENEIFDLLGDIHPYSAKNRYQDNDKNNKKLKRLYTAISVFLRRNKNVLKLFDNRADYKTIERFIDLQLIYFIYERAVDVSFPLLSVILGIPRRGIYRIKGGIRTLIDILEKQFVGYGGKIICNSAVEEIILKKGKACGVRVRHENSVSEISSRWVVSDASILHTESKLIREERKKKQLAKIDRRARHGIAPFSVMLGVDEKVIPEPMGEYAIMMRDYDLPAKGDNIISISVNPAGDETGAPHGKRSITATYFIPVDESLKINWEKERGHKIEEVINFLEQVIPFVSEFIDCVYSFTPDDYQHATGSYDIVKHFGINSNLYGLGGFPAKTPVGRLLMVSDDEFSGSGIAHTIKSGIQASEEILKRI